MTEKHCEEGQCLPKEYDGKYRCMTCYKEFTVVEEEDVMNTATLAPAIARIQELETENRNLMQKLAALKIVITAMRNLGPVPVSQHDNTKTPL